WAVGHWLWGLGSEADGICYQSALVHFGVFGRYGYACPCVLESVKFKGKMLLVEGSGFRLDSGSGYISQNPFAIFPILLNCTMVKFPDIRPISISGMTLLCWVMVIVPLSSLRSQNTMRPNIIMIITDDQGFGDFGFTGNPHVLTPHLDR